MRFVVDAQLPPALARWLEEHGHVAEHVADLGLASADDRDVWAYATAAGAVIVTKDEDFALRRAHSIGEPSAPKVVWVRSGNTSRRELLRWFDTLLPAIIEAFERGEPLVEIA